MNRALVFCVVAGQLNISAVSFTGTLPAWSFFIHGDEASAVHIMNLTVVDAVVLQYGHIIHIRDMDMPMMMSAASATNTRPRPRPRSAAHANANADFVPHVSLHASSFTGVRTVHTQAGVFFVFVSEAAAVAGYAVTVENVVVSGMEQQLSEEDLHDDELTNDGEVISVVLRVLFEWGGPGGGSEAEGERERKRANANAGIVQLTNMTFVNNSISLVNSSDAPASAPVPAQRTRTHSHSHSHSHSRQANRKTHADSGANPFFILPWPLALLTVTGQPGPDGPAVTLQGVTISNSSTYEPPELGSVALFVDGGVVAIAEDVRIGANESVPYTGYPSYRQNIACAGGATLRFTTWNGEAYDPALNQSLWIDGLSGHCVIDGPYSAVLSPMCVPMLLNATLVTGETPGWEAYGAAVLYTGKMLFPLNATFDIYEVDSSSPGEEELTTISVDALFNISSGIDPNVANALRTLTQSQCGGYIYPDALAQIAASPNEWRARMWFGVSPNNDSDIYLPTGFLETAYYTIRPAKSDPDPSPWPEPEPKPKKTNGGAIAAAVIVPLVIVAAIVITVIIVCVVRRRKSRGYQSI